jgi:integrase
VYRHRVAKKPEIRKTSDDVLTAVEVDRLVAALADVGEKYANLRTNGRYAALVFAGARLGPRWNEAIGLRICDVDLARREVTFGRVVVNQNDSKPFPERGSTTDDWRTVPAPTPVIDALARHIERCVTTPRIGTRSCSPLGTGPIRCGRTSPASCVKLPTATACVAGGSPG